MNSNSVAESYRQLKEKAAQGYWAQRILAETGYLMELLYGKEDDTGLLIEEAVGLLEQEYEKNGLITPEAAERAEQLLLPLSERAKEYTLICAAHAHIDMNWMWGYQETVTVTLDTVRTMLRLMEEYPGFTFSQSQASVYRIVEEYAPELLKEIRARVKEGRWEVTASTWVENDKNMPAGEAMARHLLYTKRYLSELLDISMDSLNLDFEPDTFGHSRNMPEILQKGGVSRYYHCRGYDGEFLYRFKGISDAEVLAYREPYWYNAAICYDMCCILPEFCRRYGMKAMLKVYGVGDHGGGPTRRDLNLLQDMAGWPLLPNIRFGTFREFFDLAEARRDSLPLVDQELNYVFTGCYTSQSRIKAANHMGEARLTEAEALDCMALLENGDYTRAPGFEKAWRKVLFNQFHDILPGSGTVETREYALGEFQKAMAAAGANAVRAMDFICRSASETDGLVFEDTALGAGAGSGADAGHGYGFSKSEMGSGSVRHVAVYNTTQYDREEMAEIMLWDWDREPDQTRVCDMEERELPFQVLERGSGYWGHTFCKMLVWINIPPFGYNICRIMPLPADRIGLQFPADSRTDHITDEDLCMENDRIRAVFERSSMKCVSLIRKCDGADLIVRSKPACGFQLITEDTSQGMTAWRVGKIAAVKDLNGECEIYEEGENLTGIHKYAAYRLSFGSSSLHVKISLDEGSDLLQFQVRADWMERGSKLTGVPQLRFCVPCGYAPKEYRYTIPFGVTDRPSQGWDVPSVSLACALPESGAGALALISDSKYGFRGFGETLSLNLIRGSYNPDPCPEIGEHEMRFAVAVCESGASELAELSEKFLHPLISRSMGGYPRKSAGCRSFCRVEGAVLSAVKAAEDDRGLIVRIYNVKDVPSEARIYLPGRKLEAYRCDFMERDQEKIDTPDEETVLYELQPGEVCSFRVVLK